MSGSDAGGFARTLEDEDAETPLLSTAHQYATKPES
jgi:hypothetical protein